MNKYFLFLVMLLLNSAIIIAGAPFDYRYQGDPHRSSVSYYYNYDYYDNYNPPVPIFKGSYGNYRYQMYANGDYSPNYFFIDYPEYSFRPYFSGGYGNNLYGLGYYNYGYYPYYNYYGYNYYPIYSYSYII